MIVKDLIKKLKEYEDDTIVHVEFEYTDSDEGDCGDSFYEFNFEFSESARGRFLTITDGER